MKPDCFTKTASTVLGDAEPIFNERHRALFLEICGIPQLSKSVKAEPLTESLSPCPSMQALVRTVVPYIQRFLYHHDELSEVYADLLRNNIREKIKQLCFAQVRSSQYVQNRLEWECVFLVWIKLSSPGMFHHTQFELFWLLTGGEAVHPLRALRQSVSGGAEC